ncbi:MAG: trans-2-enoyl-CoA reductase family protein [Candidatus Didemnitutus sp.]|nr:trans-2-enoyl-CoA reductase family protein [Candidatus Didemnitutus sp.]
MIIKPKVRGFVCVTAHPTGCAAHVQEQIDYVKAKGPLLHGPRNVLVVGSSTGYGLGSRIAAAYGSKAKTLGVFFERPAEEGRLATAGWYNTIAFTNAARADGLYAENINGDAFSDNIKQQALAIIARDMGPIDLVVYSLASPRRTHPRTGVVHKSTLQPIGASYTNKTVDTDKGVVSEVTIPPADETSVADTIAVMGGEDWEMWMQALADANLLAPGATTMAYSYIGPSQTWAVYRDGAIGRAKLDLERAARALNTKLAAHGGGRAFISVNKALVTQASSAIPVVPLYIAILYKVMKEAGLHEGCIEQMQRLFATQLYNGSTPTFDSDGRVRVDDWEMRDDVQAKVAEIWPQVTTENLPTLTDIAGYRTEFLKLFGFGLAGVDYDADVDPNIQLP